MCRWLARRAEDKHPTRRLRRRYESASARVYKFARTFELSAELVRYREHPGMIEVVRRKLTHTTRKDDHASVTFPR